MTNEGNRNASRVEFDNTYFAIDDDVDRLISSRFGLKGKALEQFGPYIERKAPLLEQLSQSLFVHLKMANGLYPTSRDQLEERQMHQKYAAGCCYGLLTLYERIFSHTGISRDKHIDVLKHIQKELNSIKAWRDNDRKRFKF